MVDRVMEVGIRVVRGPDWHWGTQDGGEGSVGTVVEIGKPGNSNTPDKTAVVLWDNGFRTNYRVGYQSAYDLRVYDMAPTGMKHPNILCNGCKKQGVMGILWRCTRCRDYDLCNVCYMEDAHDLNHPFIRLESAHSVGVKVGKRAGAVKIQARGIFPGAEVTRGPDWDWGNQDGGEGKKGTVLDLRGWDNESGRSVANITWPMGNTNVYRLGHKGKVDLKCTQPAAGGFYYRDHLLVLGQDAETKSTVNLRHDFKVGDRVKCELDVELLKALQEGHGGWNPRMADYIGKVGSVHRITDKGDVRVQFDGCSNRWTFFPGTLTKVQYFSIGDYVKVSDDVSKVRSLQKGHGEWTESMKTALGKTGRVQKVYADGDLRIMVGPNTWTINPNCCAFVPPSERQQNENSNTPDMERPKLEEDPSDSVAEYLAQLKVGSQSTSSGAELLVKEAAQGHVHEVSDTLSRYPDLVDCKSSGKTALQVASHQGHMEMVELLLQKKADLHVPDVDGDTPMHFASFGNQPEITELLINSGARLDQVNKGGCTALHIAVNKRHTDCVRQLTAYQCNPNVQDSYGDTALHDAICKDDRAIIDLLLAVPDIDFTLKNKRGFNALHHAALKGNAYVTTKVLQKVRDIVNLPKQDGFSALHLASLNGHFEVVKSLLDVGRADIEIKNNRRQTPLFLAVAQCHAHVVELLFKKGASLTGSDEDGDTILHLALSPNVLHETLCENSLLHAPITAQIHSQLVGAGVVTLPGLAVACYLLQKGADPSAKNSKSQTPFEVLDKPDMVDILQRYIKHSPEATAIPSTSRPVTEAKPSAKQRSEKAREKGATKGKPGSAKTAPVCVVCEEMFACVTFQPCGHTVVCLECCLRLKTCLKCSARIEQKYGPDKKPIATLQRRETPEQQRLRQLEEQLQSMEDTVNCSICMERRKTVAFMCGHSACRQCAGTLKVCHICRKAINKKIALYES